MKKANFNLSPSTAKYNNMRLSLLLILIFSTVNLFSPLMGFYMLFSAYIPQLLAQLGAYFYITEGILLLYIFMVILALILLVPYLLCWIFSKKHVGWMIGALALFSIDTLFFLIDLVALLAAGDFSFLLDLLFHIYALVSLIMGVKYGFDMKKTVATETVSPSSQAEGEESTTVEGTRQLTLTRKKSFVGCAMRMSVYVDSEAVYALKNGESTTVTVPARSFTLGAAFSNGLVSGKLPITAGSDDLSYTLILKSGLTANTILFQSNAPQE